MEPDFHDASGVALQRGLAVLHAATDCVTAGEAALELLALRGCPGARLWLDAGGQRIARPVSGVAGSGLQEARAAEALAGLPPGTPVRLDLSESGDGLWDLIALPLSGAAAGMLAVPAVSGADPQDLLVLVASLLGGRTAELRAVRDLEGERERNAGWFKTLDDQIRILEGERQKLSVLVNKTDAAVFVADPDGTITWVNPVMARWYQTASPGKGLVGAPCRSWCGEPEDCDTCPVRTVRNGAPLVHQERKDVRGNETRHVYVSSFPVRSPEGRVNSVLTMLQDITDLDTLRRSQARYQLLFERSTDAMVMARTDTLAIVMANRQARELFGMAPGGEIRTLLQLHPPAIRAGMEAHYTRLRRGRNLENLEVEVLADGGGVKTVNACGTLFDLDGSEAILVEFRDVTHLRELQAELARADHLITLGTMNAGIAHEFKNRLAPLRAFAQLLTKETLHLPRVLAHAPLMIQEIDRLTALVRDVLDYARPQEPVPGVEDLASLARDLAEEFRGEFSDLLGNEEIRFVIEPGDERYPVWIDPVQLRRAFLNLFKNAVEAMEGWEGEKILTVGAGQEGDHATLTLKDTGRGIDRSSLGRIFDPFFTTKGPRGTGLGMCITKSLIEANGGDVRVTSASGKGTQVVIRFPLAGRSVAPSPGESGILPSPVDVRRAA